VHARVHDGLAHLDRVECRPVQVHGDPAWQPAARFVGEEEKARSPVPRRLATSAASPPGLPSDPARSRTTSERRPPAAPPAPAKTCRQLADIDGLRGGVDAPAAARLITYFCGIDGLARAQRILNWPVARTTDWLLPRPPRDCQD
jgi:hypothetical protein